MKILFTLFLSFLSLNNSYSQKLSPGFDPVEYKNLLLITAAQGMPGSSSNLPKPDGYELVYTSPTVGLDNLWTMWLREDSVCVISIRGTTLQMDSWSEDFYAAMVPAQGTIIISPENIFSYKLAEHPDAHVHSGWLIGLGTLVPTIIEQINVWHEKGMKEFIILGHSQGGAITYLLTSYLHYYGTGQIPDDVKFKTYSSAPPKPGNVYYSYDYDNITRGGWALRVYNSEDWVPQMPITIQTMSDFAPINPFSLEDSLTAKMGFLDKIFFDLLLDFISGKLDDSRDILREILGNVIYDKSISKYLPQIGQPVYSETMNYYPCGVPVVLMVTPGYYDYVKTLGLPTLFENHLMSAYLYLLEKNYGE